MKYLCLFLMIIFFCSCANNEFVTGHVYNGNDVPLDSVKVLVNGTDIYTYTNKEGYFEIDTKGLNQELLFDKEGYELMFEKIEHDEKIRLKRRIE